MTGSELPQPEGLPPVLYEDGQLLVVAKPPGLITMGAPAGKVSLVELVRQYLRQQRPGQARPFVGVVSRLDAPVSGVVPLALSARAAARLTRQFRQGEVDKIYWALVHGTGLPMRGEWVNYLRPLPGRRKMQVVGPSVPGARECRLRFRVLQVHPVQRITWVEIQLLTGRKHQIRAQFAGRGHPILGDLKYGSPRPCREHIALHCRELTFEHPITRRPLRLRAPLPPQWRRWGIAAPGPESP